MISRAARLGSNDTPSLWQSHQPNRTEKVGAVESTGEGQSHLGIGHDPCIDYFACAQIVGPESVGFESVSQFGFTFGGQRSDGQLIWCRIGGCFGVKDFDRFLRERDGRHELVDISMFPGGLMFLEGQPRC